jgi:hypothetical protein
MLTLRFRYPLCVPFGEASLLGNEQDQTLDYKGREQLQKASSSKLSSAYSLLNKFLVLQTSFLDAPQL